MKMINSWRLIAVWSIVVIAYFICLKVVGNHRLALGGVLNSIAALSLVTVTLSSIAIDICQFAQKRNIEIVNWLNLAAFIFPGLLSVIGLWYFMIDDWPMIIGGKPPVTSPTYSWVPEGFIVLLPALIPIMTILLYQCRWKDGS